MGCPTAYFNLVLILYCLATARYSLPTNRSRQASAPFLPIRRERTWTCKSIGSRSVAADKSKEYNSVGLVFINFSIGAL